MSAWLVTGRLCGDDEDAALVFSVETREGAIAAFKEQLYADARMDDGEIALAEVNGEGVFINCVAWSASTISIY